MEMKKDSVELEDFGTKISKLSERFHTLRGHL
jgi:hypothetical protein